MALVTHTFRESTLKKLQQSLCKKILQQMPSVANLTYIISAGPDSSYRDPEPPLPSGLGDTEPNQLYSGMLPGVIAGLASLSSTMLASIVGSGTSGYWNWTPNDSQGPGLAGTWNGSEIINMGAGRGTAAAGSSAFWSIQPTAFPIVYNDFGETPPYLYSVGASLAGTEAALYGSFAGGSGGGGPTGAAMYVGNRRYVINQYNWHIEGPNGSPLKTVGAGIQYGTTPVVWTDGNGLVWTLANGNGWVLIPIPEYNENTVIISAIAPPPQSGLSCSNTSVNGVNNCNGLINTLTILPAV
jgi:hypothetical protein